MLVCGGGVAVELVLRGGVAQPRQIVPWWSWSRRGGVLRGGAAVAPSSLRVRAAVAQKWWSCCRCRVLKHTSGYGEWQCGESGDGRENARKKLNFFFFLLSKQN